MSYLRASDITPSNGARNTDNLSDDHAINAHEVMLMLGVSRPTLTRLQKAGELPQHWHFGGRRLWLKGDIRAYRDRIMAQCKSDAA